MTEHKTYNFYFIIILSFAAIVTGLASAFFLYTLDLVTNFRESKPSIIYFLPIAGILISWLYVKFGKSSDKGNNLIIAEYYQPKEKIPAQMSVLVYIGTLLTHLFGGSAGREGTSVQIAASISDQFRSLIKLNEEQRKLLLQCAVASGFASVFGTPLTAIFFSLEILRSRKHKVLNLLLNTTMSYIAHVVCLLTGIKHSSYLIKYAPVFSSKEFFFTAIAGVLFGLTALLFIKLNSFWKSAFSIVKNKTIQTFIAGLIIVLFYYLSNSTRHLGLGVPVIEASFKEAVLPLDFLIKILLTTFTISLGFKGGEVTPLFFIGATLGNTIGMFIPFDFSILAGLGLCSVFAAATKTPLASAILALELFGISFLPYALISCILATLASGKNSIYLLHNNYLYEINYFRLFQKR